MGYGASDAQLRIVHKIRVTDMVGAEYMAHLLFQEQHVRDEWFKLNRRHVAAFRRLKADDLYRADIPPKPWLAVGLRVCDAPVRRLVRDYIEHGLRKQELDCGHSLVIGYANCPVYGGHWKRCGYCLCEQRTDVA